jgi:hypothetical protein
LHQVYLENADDLFIADADRLPKLHVSGHEESLRTGEIPGRSMFAKL